MSSNLVCDPRTLLPDELFLLVAERLDVTSLLVAATVSKSWRSICLDGRLWKNLYLKSRHLHPAASWKSETDPATKRDGHTSIPRLAAAQSWYHLYQKSARTEWNWNRGVYNVFTLPDSHYPWEGHAARVLVIHQQGHRLVSGGQDRTVRRWNLETKRLIGLPLRGHEGEVLALQYDAARDLIVSGCTRASLILWTFSTGHQLHRLEHIHNSFISSILLQDKSIITGSRDGSIKIWSGDWLSTEVEGTRYDVASPDRVSSIREIGLVLNLDTTLLGHTGAIASMSVGGCELVSASDDQTIRIWDTHTGQCMAAKIAPDAIVAAHLEGHNTIGGTRGGVVDIIEHGLGKIPASLHSGDRLLTTALATRARLDQGRIISGDIRGYITVWKMMSEQDWIPAYSLHVKDLISSACALPAASEPRTCGPSSIWGQEVRRKIESAFSQVHADFPSKRPCCHKELNRPTPSKSCLSKADSFNLGHAKRSLAAQLSLPLRPSIIKLQTDGSKLLCCNGGSLILGLDFACDNVDDFCGSPVYIGVSVSR